MKGAQSLSSVMTQPPKLLPWLPPREYALLASLSIPTTPLTLTIDGPGYTGVILRSDGTIPWARAGWILSPMIFVPWCYSHDHVTSVAKETLQMWWRLLVRDFNIGRWPGMPNLIMSLLKTEFSLAYSRTIREILYVRGIWPEEDAGWLRSRGSHGARPWG